MNLHLFELKQGHGKMWKVASRPTVGRLVRGLDDRLWVGLLADRQE